MKRKVRSKRKAGRSSPLKGLQPGMRMKGGIRFDPQLDSFVAIVHTWDNAYGRGEPEEWRSPELFPTEEAAMKYYKTAISPSLTKMMAKMAKEQPDITLIQRKLEE